MRIQGKQLADTLRSESAPFDRIYSSQLTGGLVFKAKNASAQAMTIGQAVYISGVSGEVPEVLLADADGVGTTPAAGLIATGGNASAEVWVIALGELKNVNTGSFSEGDTLYVGATAGALVNTPPTGESAKLQNIGRVVRSDASSGVIFVGGAGRTAATPNLDQGKIFIGNASNQSSSSVYTLPITDGNAGDVLTTDGAGAVTFSAPSGGQASSTVITSSPSSLANGGEVYTIGPTASSKVYIVLQGNTLQISDGDRIKVENLSGQVMQISSSRNVYTGVGELAPYTYLPGSNLWSGNKYRLDLESRGTIELVYQGGSYYSSYYPAIETSVDSIEAGDLLGYSKVRNAIERAGDYILSADINGTIEALFTYATAYDESTARTITLPSPYTLEAYCEALNGKRITLENRGASTLSLENASAVYNNGIYYRTYLRYFDDTNAGNQTLQSGEYLIIEFEYEVVTSTTHHLYARIKKYGHFPSRVIESDSSATDTTLSTGTELEKIVYVENSATAVTMTLPTISGVKDGYVLTLKALGSANVTVSRGGTDTIDGTTSSLTLTQNQSVVLAKASGGWNVVQAVASSGGGSSAPAVTSPTPSTNYTITSSTGIEEIFLIDPSADIDVVLVSATTAGSGYKYHIKNLSASYTLTLKGAGSETIDGIAPATGIDIDLQYETVTVVSNGSNWFII